MPSKTTLPSVRNPFADFVIQNMGSSIYLLDQMREAAWDDKENALGLMFAPEVPEDLDHLKETIVDRFREMAEEAWNQLEDEESDDPEFFFEVAPLQLKVNGLPVLLVKVYQKTAEEIQKKRRPAF